MNIFEMKKVEDLTEILRVMHACADDFPAPELKRESRIHEIAQRHAQLAEFYVMYSGTEICGFIAYYCHDETKNAFISLLVVREKFQRQGIGKAFLDCVVKDCKDRGKDLVRLEVLTDNAKALSFYKENGFVRECSASQKSDYYILSLQNPD